MGSEAPPPDAIIVALTLDVDPVLIAILIKGSGDAPFCFSNSPPPF